MRSPLERRVVRVPPMGHKAAHGDRAQTHREHAQRNIHGHYEPKGEHVQRFVAILSFGRIVVGLVLLEDPERADYEPAEHEAVDQLLRRRLPESLCRLVLSAADARR